MVVRSRETDIRNAPGEIPNVSASHSERSRRGEWSARIASSRRWPALGRSIAEPSAATVDPAQQPHALDARPPLIARTLSHAALFAPQAR